MVFVFGAFSRYIISIFFENIQHSKKYLTNNFIIIIVIIRNVMVLTGFNALIISLMGKLVFKCFQHKENMIWLRQCIPNQTDENIDISDQVRVQK